MMDRRKTAWCFFAAAALIVAAFVLSVRVGKFPLTSRDIGAILAGRETDDLARGVFWTLRLPRACMGLLAGAGLGMAGAVFQLVLKNPLASPDIIGVSSGANLGAAVCIVFLGQASRLLAASAFAGGLLAVLLVLALARAAGRGSTASYVLAGIVMKALSEALIMLLKFYADPEGQLAAIEFWSMGSLGGVTAQKLLAALPACLIGLLGLVLMRRQIALLGLDEDEGRALGVRVGPVRAAVLALCTLLVSAIVSVTGLIGFIGLIAPHIARLALRRVSFAWCALSALVGALLLLLADCAARTLYSAEIPISILTTLLGVPVLILLMRRRRVGRA